ncbi:MAG: alpha/beta fold hydrolase [Candidatus Binatia bacterium]
MGFIFRLPAYLFFSGLLLVGVQWVQDGQLAATFPPTGGFVEVDGLKLHYQRAGSGPAVLLLHGCPGFLGDYQWTGDGGISVFEDLALDHTVVAIDRPGYGWSDNYDDRLTGLEEQADLIPDLLAGLGMARATLVGHSYGASLALATVVRHPESVEGLVLLGGAVYADGIEPGLLERIAALPGLGALFSRSVAPVLAPMVKAGLSEAFAPDEIPPGYEGRFTMYLARPRPLTQRATEIVGLREALRVIEPSYHAIDVPTTIIVGAMDDPSTVENNRRLADTVDDARILVIENLGHEVAHLRPALVSGEVRRITGA